VSSGRRNTFILVISLVAFLTVIVGGYIGVVCCLRHCAHRCKARRRKGAGAAGASTGGSAPAGAGLELASADELAHTQLIVHEAADEARTWLPLPEPPPPPSAPGPVGPVIILIYH
jgi:hypothetical protein